MIIHSVVKSLAKENYWNCHIDDKYYMYITQSSYYKAEVTGTYMREAYTMMYECDSTHTFYKEHKATYREYMPLDEKDPTKGVKQFLQFMMLQ